MKNIRIRNICIILVILVLFVYIAISVNSYVNNNKIGFFNTKFYIMSSDSPEANISSGDLVLANNIDVNDIKENDNIIFQRENQMLVKKVKKVENINGKNNFYIEDDDVITNEKLENAQIIGKVVSKIKGIRKCSIIYSNSYGNS